MGSTKPLLPAQHQLLEVARHVHQMEELQLMNHLQEHGVISDNCVWLEDVAEVDCVRAMEGLGSGA